MLDRLIDFVLENPRRLTSLGAVLGRAGGFLLIAGLVGRAATTAASAMDGLAGAHRSEVRLGDVLPGYLDLWVPETALGFGLAALMLVLGLWAARTGRAYERHLGI